MSPRWTDEDRRRAEGDVDDELAFHRLATIDELRASGLSEQAALDEADRRFGPLQPHRRRIVDVDLAPQTTLLRTTLMSILVSSMRGVARDIRHSPGFAFGVVCVLTLGLGINAITLGLVDRLVLSGPAGITAPEDLRHAALVRATAGGGTAVSQIGYLEYQDLQHSSQLAGVAAMTPASLLFGSGDRAERVRGLLVTSSYFPLLGVTPAVGRFFTDDESNKDGARLVVLGHAFWQSRFGADPGAIGRSIQVEDHHYTVVGVAPKNFTGTSVDRADLFLPLEAAADEQVSGPWRTRRGFLWMNAVVRLKPGVDTDAAAAEVTSRYRSETATATPSTAASRIELTPINPVRGGAASDDARIAVLVGAVAGLVMLIAFANVANLFLARSVRRRDQLAVRLALGGGRSRLIAEAAAEGAWFALFGVAIAIGVASIGAPMIRRLLFPAVDWIDAGVNLRLLLGLGIVAVVGGALVASIPVWQAGRSDITSWLKSGAHRAVRGRTPTQIGMLIVQGALSVLLLAGAGLFIRSMTAAQSLDLGLDTDRLLIVTTVSGDTPIAPDFQDRLAAAAERTPGVSKITRVAGTLPFVSSWGEPLKVQGLAELPRVEDGGPYISAVGAGYFSTVGTDIVEGRAFASTDREGAEHVAVVNQTMARLFWPGAKAIGQCLQIGNDDSSCWRVIGIAENTRRQSLTEGDALMYYIPLDQAPPTLRRSARVVIRLSDARSAQTSVPETLRRQTLDLAPSLRYVAAKSIDDIVSPQLRTWRLGAGLFSAFGLLALIVATVGLYSATTFDVNGRRREMGLRAALGASSSAVVGLVVRDALKTTAGGLIAGVALAVLLGPLLADLLYAVPAQDPWVLAASAASLAVAALIASAIPGLRASRVDPTTALRDE